MIVGIFYQSSGLGNQLARYVATRVLALDKGYEWGMLYNANDSSKEEGFKGHDFMRNVERGEIGKMPKIDTMKWWTEKKIVENGVDIRAYDPEFNFIEDNTIIDGEFQDERYWEHREKEVNEWLKVEPLEMPDDLCVIGFRGGEFSLYPDLFLTKQYWDEGIAKMREINPNMRFEVHTDDKVLAQQFFPEFQVIHDIGINWRSMRFAKYAIIANSSFFILPRWLKQGEIENEKCKVCHFPRREHDFDYHAFCGRETGYTQITGKETMTIAPRWWGRRNTKVWSLPSNYYGRFQYL